LEPNRASCLGYVAVFSFFRLLLSLFDFFEFGSTELFHLLPHILNFRIQILQLDRHSNQPCQHLNHCSSGLQIRVHSSGSPQETRALQPSLPADTQDYTCGSSDGSSLCQFSAHLLQTFSNNRVAYYSVYCSYIVPRSSAISSHCENHLGIESLGKVQDYASDLILARYARLRVPR